MDNKKKVACNVDNKGKICHACNNPHNAAFR